MKKILVYYSQLNIGGAEKSLIRLMNAFVESGDEVSFLGRYGQGKGEYLLDDKIRKMALCRKPPVPGKGLKALVSRVACLFERCISQIKLKLQNQQYDLALVGLQGLSPRTIYRYTHSRTIAVFIRNDLSRMKGKDRVIKTLRKNGDTIDYYICVAQTVKESLIKEIPEFCNKAVVIYNILDSRGMRENMSVASNPFENEQDEVFRILSVCRISDASKGVLRMVDICKRLVDEGYRFRWYIVGDGPDMCLLHKAIIDNGLENVMMTPGRVDNPFGFYRECDLVAMLSYYEGLCGVVNEAKVSGKAIIATEVSGVWEQLEHGVNGWVVKNDTDSILEGMRFLLCNKVVIRKLSNDIYPEAILNDVKKIKSFHSLADSVR